MRVLVLNAGSSSIKYRLYDMKEESLLLSGKVERIGESTGSHSYHHYHASDVAQTKTEDFPVTDYAAGLKLIFETLKSCGLLSAEKLLHAIGHRVVHGGEKYQSATLINENVIEAIRQMIPLAPLHNPANLNGIEIACLLYPQVPQVAVFDTAFFRSLPAKAYRYALPDELYKHHGIRRYGFHGTSHQHVAKEAARYLQQPVEKLRLITLHLGNGASAAAICEGNCIDTSMGMTPLAGLVMGTRCGDLDPSVHFYLARILDMDLDAIEAMLNYKSGMKGLCGLKDMREVHKLADAGNKQAQLALEIYCYQICKYIGAYYLALGGLDALVFTGGIGENDSVIRQQVCNQLSVLGITLDDHLNQSAAINQTEINGKDSKVKVLVIPANEEIEIARQTILTIGNTA